MQIMAFNLIKMILWLTGMFSLNWVKSFDIVLKEQILDSIKIFQLIWTKL